MIMTSTEFGHGIIASCLTPQSSFGTWSHVSDIGPWSSLVQWGMSYYTLESILTDKMFHFVFVDAHAIHNCCSEKSSENR